MQIDMLIDGISSGSDVSGSGYSVSSSYSNGSLVRGPIVVSSNNTTITSAARTSNTTTSTPSTTTTTLAHLAHHIHQVLLLPLLVVLPTKTKILRICQKLELKSNQLFRINYPIL